MAESTATVSIVVPTYNQGCFIEECLASIRDQDHAQFEVVIQDSMSNDQTEAICRRFATEDSRFRYFREKDKGQSDAINLGLGRSSGKYWTWICSDDYYANPKALSSLVNALESFAPDTYVGAYGTAQYVSEKGRPRDIYNQLHRDLVRGDFRDDWPLSQPASLLVRSAIDAMGGVRSDLFLGMDLDMFIRLLDHGRKLRYVPHEVAKVRLQAGSKSVLYRKKTAETALRIIQSHFGTIGNRFTSAYVREYTAAERLEAIGALIDHLRPLKRYLLERGKLPSMPPEPGTVPAEVEDFDPRTLPLNRKIINASGVKYLVHGTLALYFRLRFLGRKF